MERILIVEDELPLARFLELELTHEGYETKVVLDGASALETALREDHDFILLDLQLPGMDGTAVCRRIREKKNTPIVMITARNAVSDRVAGLDSGADDYITKPFAIEEILARLRSIKRRFSSLQETKSGCQIADLILDPQTRRITRNGHPIELSAREFDLLQFMMENTDVVLTREYILNQVWGYQYIGETNVVDVYIRYLRVKIDEPYEDKLIHTVRGIGYVLRNPDGKAGE